MKPLLVFASLLVCASATLACDSRLPRCQQSKAIVDTLGYREKVAELQMGCRGRAAAMSPDTLHQKSPAKLLGILPGTDGWEQLNKAYDMYLEEACGGDEVVYLLLAGYRAAWDARLPGDELERALTKAKEGGREAVEDDAQAVSKEVNRVLGPLIASMEVLAESNYTNRIKGVLSGEALALDSGPSCAAP